jgi:hypothetical protein
MIADDRVREACETQDGISRLFLLFCFEVLHMRSENVHLHVELERTVFLNVRGNDETHLQHLMRFHKTRFLHSLVARQGRKSCSWTIGCPSSWNL